MNKSDEAAKFSAEERAAMRARAKELKAEAEKADLEKEALAAIAAMTPESRVMGERIHALIKEHAPSLSAKTWYGMPAYANAEGKVVVFFRAGEKFKERYLTLGFNQDAKLDEGEMWPIAYAITAMTPEVEQQISETLRKSVG